MSKSFSKFITQWWGRLGTTRVRAHRVKVLTIAPAAIVASLLVTGITVAVRTWGGLQSLELAAYDALSNTQLTNNVDPRLVAITITEADIQGANRWPLSDKTLATALARLQQYQPRVIGLDIYRNVPEPPGTASLKQQLQAPNVITIEKLGDPQDDGVPPPPDVPRERVGFNDFLHDPDDVVRRGLLYAYEGEQKFYAFSLRLALAYLARDGKTLQVNPQTLTIGDTLFKPLQRHSGSYRNLESKGYQIMITYRSSRTVAREITITQVLQGNIEPAWIRDKIVLIGSTAPSLKDVFLTPYSSQTQENADKLPGVSLHAQLVSQILSTVLDRQPLIWYWAEGLEVLWIWVFALAGGLLAWRNRHPVVVGLAGLGTIALLIGICTILFMQAGWIPLVPPILALVLTMGSVVAYRSFYQTFYDPLSGLPNRALILKVLQQELTQSRRLLPVALLFLGLDRFEVIRNSLGHRASDQLIVEVTRRLRHCLQHPHTLAWVGDDEFVILLHDLADMDQPVQIADQLHQSMAQPFVLKEQQVFTGVSIGIAFSQPDAINHPEDLLRDARTARDRARRLGNDRHEVFAAGMRVQVVRQLQLETDLRHAIEHSEFQLYYQPIIALETHELTGFEALIRWHHPQHGFIAPSEFIPVSEETGLIIPLGQWILREACQQLQVWQTQFPTNPPITISVNLSGQQLIQPNLVEQVEQILKQVGIDGRGLKLEITESVAMSDAEATIALLKRLKSLNLRLSIDDFGTGYSSLSYLHRFPVDTLKIDRSFINQMGDEGEDTTIVQTILVLGHALGMDIVAEGVETVVQKQTLQKLRCEYGQGYLFSKPVNSETATQLLTNHFCK